MRADKHYLQVTDDHYADAVRGKQIRRTSLTADMSCGFPKGHRRAGDVSPLIRWQRIRWRRKKLILSAPLHVVLVRMAFRFVAPSRD
jgi:hypothetical protein